MKNLRLKMEKALQKMLKTGKLYVSSIDGNTMWDTYLSSFDDDPIFRDPESSVHNCNGCKSSIRRYANIVAIDKNNKVITLFDFKIEGEYSEAVKQMGKLLKAAPIRDVFVEKYDFLNQKANYESTKKNQSFYLLGLPTNRKVYTKGEAKMYGVVKEGEMITFEHISIKMPKEFISFTAESVESIQGKVRSSYDVLSRGFQEISLDTLLLVKDLINQGSILSGEAYMKALNDYIKMTKDFKDIPVKQQKNWVWKHADSWNAKFRNTLIGTLCVELSQGEELNKACLNWNKRVDPANYKKATAPITQKQIDMCNKVIEDNGYEASFERKVATLDDVVADNRLFVNSGDGSIQKVSVLGHLKPTKSHQHKKNEFKGIKEIPVDEFMEKILPTCQSVELYLENSMESNLVTMTTSKDVNAKNPFQWDNPFSYTYKGGLAGKSMIKDAVSRKGGNVSGVMRFSIMWADNNGDNSDLDAHCNLPNRKKIFYSNKIHRKFAATLDIDITNPANHEKDVVENIIFTDKSKIFDGQYKFRVHQYAARNSKGFSAEIEINGEMYSYEYPNPLTDKSYVDVATVTMKNGVLTIKHHLPDQNKYRELYGLETKKFHKVNLLSLSPNYWNKEIGKKHYFFFLDKMKNEEPVRSFHVENLNSGFHDVRKVMEYFANTKLVEPVPNGLNGVGYIRGTDESVILKLKGSHKRTVKVIF